MFIITFIKRRVAAKQEAKHREEERREAFRILLLGAFGLDEEIID